MLRPPGSARSPGPAAPPLITPTLSRPRRGRRWRWGRPCCGGRCRLPWQPRARHRHRGSQTRVCPPGGARGGDVAGRCRRGAVPGAESSAPPGLDCSRRGGRAHGSAGGDAAGIGLLQEGETGRGARGRRRASRAVATREGAGNPTAGMTLSPVRGNPSCGRRSPRFPEASSPRPQAASGPNMDNMLPFHLRAILPLAPSCEARPFFPTSFRCSRVPPSGARIRLSLCSPAEKMRFPTSQRGRRRSDWKVWAFKGAKTCALFSPLSEQPPGRGRFVTLHTC